MAARYSLAMQAHGGGEGYELVHTVEGYPWGELKDGATVVDVSYFLFFFLSLYIGVGFLRYFIWTKLICRWGISLIPGNYHHKC